MSDPRNSRLGMPADADRELALAERLAEARAQTGLSQGAVAEALGIPRSAVSLMESRQRSVSSLELMELARLYGRSVQELLEGPERAAAGPAEVVRYLRNAAPLSEFDASRLHEAEERWTKYAELEARVHGMQRFDLPTYPPPSGRTYEQGEHLAEQERRRLGLGLAPLRSIIAILEDEGVKVLMLELGEGSAVSGCYFFSAAVGPCVLVNESEQPSRRRFTAAHEYCHFLVDRGLADGDICSLDRRKEPEEQRANAFAAAFLLPAGGIQETFGDMGVSPGAVGAEDVVQLMFRFGVSFDAVLWRLYNLRWLGAGQRAHYSQLSPTQLARSLGYGDTRPGETEPKPSRFRKLAVEAWRSGALSVKELGKLLEVRPADVERMFSAADIGHGPSGRQPTAEPDWF